MMSDATPTMPPLPLENTVSAKPLIIQTRRGPVEYVEFGDGPVVLALHGAMGGYDQSLILAHTIGTNGFRFIAVSRPGYLGTPMASGRTPEDQADLYAALLDALGIRQAAVMAVSGGGPSAIHCQFFGFKPPSSDGKRL